MDYDKLFEEFQQALDATSDQELCAEFAAMGCDVYVDKPFTALVTSAAHDVDLGEVYTKSLVNLTFETTSTVEEGAYTNCSAADSNELALAA